MVWVRVRVKFRDSVKHSKVSKQNSNELTHIETTPREPFIILRALISLVLSFNFFVFYFYFTILKTFLNSSKVLSNISFLKIVQTPTSVCEVRNAIYPHVSK